MAEIEIVKADAAIKAGRGAFHLSEKSYHADPCPEPSLSSSIVKLLVGASPAHAWTAHPRLNPDWRPDKGNRRTALGSACHAKLLGHEEELVEIHYDNYRTKPAQTQRDEAIANGKTPILVKEAEKANNIVAAARRQVRECFLNTFDAGDSEVVVVYQDADFGWYRIRADWWTEDRTVIVDYKTTEGSASPEAFARRAAQMDYDIQDAFYLFVVGGAFPQLQGRMRFLFLVQEVDSPFAMSICEISETDRTIAMRKIHGAESVWIECLERGIWPGYSTEISRIELPPWHHRAWIEGELADE